jgi:predicted permease
MATPGYFRAMGIPLISGRFFTDGDRDLKGVPNVILVNRALVERYWGEEDVIGKRISFEDNPKESDWIRIVGVVGDVKDQPNSPSAEPGFWWPELQASNSEMSLVVRTQSDPRFIADALRNEVRKLDPSLAVADVKVMSEIANSSVSTPRFAFVLVGMFAGLAIVLAAIGAYGVISYSVSQRTAEFGLRMALGAQRGDVLRMVVSQAAWLAMAGTGIGIVASLAFSRVLKSLIFDVSPADPPTFAAVGLIAVAVALLACFIPARRATQADPMSALRAERVARQISLHEPEIPMNAHSRTFRKLSLLFGRTRFRKELDEEMAFHREQAEKEMVASGMTPEAARYAAMRQFGNMPRMRERSHELVGFRFETVGQDLRFAMRQMVKNPGYAVLAVFILALGIGVSVAIFGFVDAALLEPLPYDHPNRLMDVGESARVLPRSNLSYLDYVDWKRMNKTLATLDVYTGTGYLLRTSSGSEPVPAARVSDGFFSTLGVRAMLGRGFLPGDDQPGHAKIVVMTYGAWVNRFGARPDIVGQSVTLDGDNWTVVGVLPREFQFAPHGDAEFWTPTLDLSSCEKRRSCHSFYGVGRLRDGVTEQEARADLTGIAKQLEHQYPDSNRDQGASLQPLSKLIIGDIRDVLLILLAGAGLLLLIACINVASLLLVRSEGRRREIAVRGALGATPVRLARQFVTEGLLLAAAGGAAGVLVSGWIMSLMTRLIPKAVADGIPFLHLVGMNVHTAAFAGSVTLLAVALLAATPTLRLSFQPIRDGLSEGGRGAASRLWKRMGANLVVVELAVAVVLLVGAGLLGQSFYRLLHVEIGFEPDHLATVQIMAPPNIYIKDEQLTALYRDALRRITALPGVQSAGVTSMLPANCNCNTDWIRVVGKPFNGEHNEVNSRDITPDYFNAIKARMIRGRAFTEEDDSGKPLKIVINQTFASKYFPGEDPVGKTIGDGALSPKSLREVVGVVADVREGALDGEVWPTEYQAMYQGPDNYVVLVVRTGQDEAALLPQLVSTLHQIDPNLGVISELTMNQVIGSTQTALLHRFSTWLMGGFAVIALVLGVVGLYGVVAYSVSQRTREIGVRMALGAQRSTVYKMVLRQAAWLTSLGLSIGLAASIGTSMAMHSLLFGVRAWDAATLAGVAVLLGGASIAASFVPAHRAASVNPTEALRAE